MTSRSSIAQHPDVESIERDLAAGVTQAVIARRYGVSRSALSRHKISHENALEKIAATDVDTADVIARFVALANSATRARMIADISGTPQTRARAQSTELAALAALADRLGISDTTTAQLLAGLGPMVRGLQSYVLTYPENAEDLFGILAKAPELVELCQGLRAQLKKAKRQNV